MSIFNACAPNQNKYSVGVPVGCILIWSGAADQLPEGYALCNGENGTPDLRGRFILGSNDIHPVGETGGSEEVTLTLSQMPSHSHTQQMMTSANQNILTNMFYGSGNVSRSRMAQEFMAGQGSQELNTKTAGYSQPHPNMPPYYALCYIMKL